MTPLELKLWRVKRRLSQAGLAALLGVSQQTISRWELTAPPDDIDALLIAAGVRYERDKAFAAARAR